jgi:hypothetical protein
MRVKIPGSGGLPLFQGAKVRAGGISPNRICNRYLLDLITFGYQNLYMLFRCSLLCLSLLFSVVSHAQYFQKERNLITAVNNAGDDSAKILAMSKLADFYYIYRATEKGDSVLNQQLSFAELSENKNLLALTLFDKTISGVTNWTSSKYFDKALAFLDKGINYAREIKRPDYQAIAYLRKASIFRKRGKHDAAMNEVLLALTSLGNEKNDSIRAAISLETGDIALEKGKAVEAYKHYNQAYDIAYSIKNVPLQSAAFHHYFELYWRLDEKQLAKENLFKSLKLSRENNYEEGIFEDYFDLARITDNEQYYQKIKELSQKLGDERKIIRSKRLTFYHYMTFVKNCDLTLNYYRQNPDLQQAFINTGQAADLWNLGNIYKYCEKNDSALFYFTKAEQLELTENYDGVKQSSYSTIAEVYEKLENAPMAIRYYEKSLDINRGSGSLRDVAAITLKLSDLYAKLGNYQNAYSYQKQYHIVNDSVQAQAEKSQVVLLEVDREYKKHQKDLADAKVKESRIRNLQYMGISALLGMFPISKLTIKMLSFFAFICLFEFIVLLIDSYLHKVTHGEPLKIWLIKIFLIALLVPIQHFLEHGMVRFLASQRLLRMRQQLSLKRWIQKLKKPATVIEAGQIEKMEEDTAVL